MKAHSIVRWVLCSLPLLLSPALYFFARWAWPAAAAARFATEPRGDPTFLLLLAQLATFAAPVVILGLLIAKFVRRSTWAGFAYLSAIVLVSSVAYFAGSEAGKPRANAVVVECFREFATRSEPVVAAIEEFARAQGRPPTNMLELVPRFLPEEPKTGIALLPKFELLVGTKDPRLRGNPWGIQVEAGGFWLKWDECRFLPNQNYHQLHDQFVEPVGRWALIHW